MIESASDRQAMLLDLDRAFLADRRTFRAHLLDPAAEAGDTVGDKPVLLVALEDRQELELGVDSRVDRVCRHDGRVEGPFRVAEVRPTGAAWFHLVLEALPA